MYGILVGQFLFISKEVFQTTSSFIWPAERDEQSVTHPERFTCLTAEGGT